MLVAYKHDENHELLEVALDAVDKGSWLNCAAPDAEELGKLHELTGIPIDALQTALDREERSHVELEDDLYLSLSIHRSFWKRMRMMRCRWVFSLQGNILSPCAWKKIR